MTEVHIHATVDHSDPHHAQYRVNAWEGNRIAHRWLTGATELDATRAVKRAYGVTPHWTYDDPIYRTDMHATIRTRST